MNKMKKRIIDLELDDWFSYGKRVLIVVGEPEMVGMTKDVMQEPIYQIECVHHKEKVIVKSTILKKFNVL
ncbi:MAG: hypothetical protein RLZZ469_1646 [Bacteroidota bacterium]|jgi:hypothetical protein